MLHRFIHSPVGRVALLAAGFLIVLNAVYMPILAGIPVALIGTVIAVMAISGVCVSELIAPRQL